MPKQSTSRSLKTVSSPMLLDSFFGKGAARSFVAFMAKGPEEKALAAARSRARILKKKLEVAKRTSAAASTVRKKQLSATQDESLAMAAELTTVSAHRDQLLTENAELLAEIERRVSDPYDQKRLDQSSAETHALLVGCAEAFSEVDPEGAKRFFRSQGNSATRVLATSITKVYSPKTLPGGKSKSGRASPSSW